MFGGLFCAVRLFGRISKTARRMASIRTSENCTIILDFLENLAYNKDTAKATHRRSLRLGLISKRVTYKIRLVAIGGFYFL